jgi:hypothetical protein
MKFRTTVLVVLAIPLMAIIAGLPNIVLVQGIDCAKLPFDQQCLPHVIRGIKVIGGPGPWPDHDCPMCGHLAFIRVPHDQFWIAIGINPDPHPWIVLHPGPRGFMVSSLPLSNGTVLVQTMSTTPMLNSTAMNQSSASSSLK